jgi:hypothetical protein
MKTLSYSLSFIFGILGAALQVIFHFFPDLNIGVRDEILPFVATIATAIAAFLAFSWRNNYPPKSSQVFISYKSEDRDDARKIAERIRSLGYKTWLDIENIQPGELWRNSIEEAIKDSVAVLVLISPTSSKLSSNFNKELELAMSIARSPVKSVSPVIPIILKEAELPQQLSHVYALRLDGRGGDGGQWHELEEVLKRLSRGWGLKSVATQESQRVL